MCPVKLSNFKRRASRGKLEKGGGVRVYLRERERVKTKYAWVKMYEVICALLTFF